MCGIILAINKKGKHTGRRVFDRYTKQKSRGQRGFGFLAIQDGTLQRVVRAKEEEEIKVELLKETADTILFHHRMPTSTPNTIGTTHPIFVSHDELEHDYYIMHNGVISNHMTLKKKHNDLGYVYNTEYKEEVFAHHTGGRKEFIKHGEVEYNDSESLAIEIARFMENKGERIGTYGAAAFIGIRLVKGTQRVADIIFGQNYGRSLGVMSKKGWTVIASEGGKDVEKMKLFTMNPITLETEKRDLPTDKAEPVKSLPPYRGSSYDSRSWEQKNIGFRDRSSKIDDNEHNLVNAVYTKAEAEESGAPLAEFIASGRMLVDGKYETTYVPIVFAGVDADKRPLFSTTYHYEYEEEPEIELSKDQEKLEELAMKHARKQYESDYLTEQYNLKKVSRHLHSKRTFALELEITRLEEEMSSLGFDQQEVEEVVNTAYELVDYEYQERV